MAADCIRQLVTLPRAQMYEEMSVTINHGHSSHVVAYCGGRMDRFHCIDSDAIAVPWWMYKCNFFLLVGELCHGADVRYFHLP